MTTIETGPTPTDMFGEIIHRHTRADAIADGFLIEVPAHLATEAGFRLPVALTAAAWADCVTWNEEDERRKGGTGQDETGRLWDVLHMTRLAASRTHGTNRATVTLCRIPRDGRDAQPQEIRLTAHIGPGDEGEAVLTIMQPHED